MTETVILVASGAIPSGVPVARLPRYFSFSCKWHIVSVAESACFFSVFQLATLVATCFALIPLFLKPCVHYACRFSRFGWNWWTCRGASCVCTHELVLLVLPLTKSKVFLKSFSVHSIALRNIVGNTRKRPILLAPKPFFETQQLACLEFARMLQRRSHHAKCDTRRNK